MSSMDEATLEYFLKDSFRQYRTEAEEKFAVTICEKYREAIENAMDNFDEENQSWRTYRNSLWGSTIPDSIGDVISCFQHTSQIDHVALLTDDVPASEILWMAQQYYEIHPSQTAVVMSKSVRTMLEEKAGKEELEAVKKELEIVKFNLAATEDALKTEKTKVKILEGRLKVSDVEKEIPVIPELESSKSHPAFALAEINARKPLGNEPQITKVSSLSTARALAESDNTLWSLEEMLEEELRSVRAGETDHDRALVLYLDNGTKEDLKYNTG